MNRKRRSATELIRERLNLIRAGKASESDESESDESEDGKLTWEQVAEFVYSKTGERFSRSFLRDVAVGSKPISPRLRTIFCLERRGIGIRPRLSRSKTLHIIEHVTDEALIRQLRDALAREDTRIAKRKQRWWNERAGGRKRQGERSKAKG